MKVPLLIMDEATNHLDFHTVEALTQALRNYGGTLIVVSHDRGFISRVATKVLEIRDGKVIEYPGTYDEYVWSLEKGALSEADSGSPKSEEENFKRIKKLGKGSKEKRKTIERSIRLKEKESGQIEKEIGALQNRIQELNQQIEEKSGEERTAVLKELGEIPHTIISLEEKWVKVLEEKDRLNEELKSAIQK